MEDIKKQQNKLENTSTEGPKLLKLKKQIDALESQLVSTTDIMIQNQLGRKIMSLLDECKKLEEKSGIISPQKIKSFGND